MKLNRKWLLLLVGLVIVFIVDFPILTVALNSFRTTETIISSHSILPNPADPWPTTSTLIRGRISGRILDQQRDRRPLQHLLGNRPGVLWPVLQCRAFTRGSFGPYNQALLIVQMFPLILAIIPLFIFFRSLNMVNNFIPVILVYTVTQLPFATWMLRSYFDSIPRELGRSRQSGWLLHRCESLCRSSCP